MPRYNLTQTNFRSGELGQNAKGRTDIKDYFEGAEEITNNILKRIGGVSRRPGTRFIREITLLDNARLFPFIISKTEAYIVAIFPLGTNPNLGGDPHIQIFKNNGAVATVSFVDNVTSAIDIYPDIGIDPDGFQYAQSANRMFFTHSSGTMVPFMIEKLPGVDSFNVYAHTLEVGLIFRDSVSSLNEGLRTPYMDPNINSAHTLTWNGVTTVTSSLSFFDPLHVGAKFKITDSVGNTGVFLCIGYTNPTTITTQLLTGTVNTLANDNWQESSWSNYRGWPRAITIFEQRLIYGGTTSEPDTYWGSLTNNFFHMMERKLGQDTGATDVSGNNYFGDVEITDPFQFTLASGQVNPIQWMSSGRDLQIGTLGAEYTVTGGDQILSNSAIIVRQQTTHGGSPVQPARVNQALLFLSRDGKRIREFEFNFDQDTYITKNLNLLNDEIINHLFDAGTDTYVGTQVVQLFYHESRGVLWVRNNIGGFVGLTIDRSSDTVGWHRHTLGGVTSNGTPAEVRGMCIIPNEDGDYDELFINVEREINGTTVYYLERITADFDHPNINNDYSNLLDIPIFSDSARVLVSGVPTNSFAVPHLEGEEVIVLADGTVHPPVTVAGGGILLNDDFTQVVVGLPYTSRIKTMPIEGGSVSGTGQGRIKAVDTIYIRFHNTYAAKVGCDANFLEELTFRPGNHPMGNPLVPFSGIKTVHPEHTPDQDTQLIIETSDPLPCNVLAVTARGVTYD